MVQLARGQCVGCIWKPTIENSQDTFDDLSSARNTHCCFRDSADMVHTASQTQQRVGGLYWRVVCPNIDQSQYKICIEQSWCYWDIYLLRKSLAIFEITGYQAEMAQMEVKSVAYPKCLISVENWNLLSVKVLMFECFKVQKSEHLKVWKFESLKVGFFLVWHPSIQTRGSLVGFQFNL